MGEDMRWMENLFGVPLGFLSGDVQQQSSYTQQKLLEQQLGLNQSYANYSQRNWYSATAGNICEFSRLLRDCFDNQNILSGHQSNHDFRAYGRDPWGRTHVFEQQYPASPPRQTKRQRKAARKAKLLRDFMNAEIELSSLVIPARSERHRRWMIEVCPVRPWYWVLCPWWWGKPRNQWP